MVRIRLRTKFLLSMVLITAGLTSLSLLIVRQSVQSEATQEIFSDLRNSVVTFQSFQHERELTLSHSADLLADLPILRALMTTNHEATIQDGSAPVWLLGGSDLFVLADRSGKLVALHTRTPGFTREMAQESLALSSDHQDHWWQGAQRLYEVFRKPIYFGPAAEGKLLGFLIIGYEIDDHVASQIGRIASSEVVFRYGDNIVTSTLSPATVGELERQRLPGAGASQATSLQLGNERFLGTTLELAPEGSPRVRLTVLKSYDQATAFLQKINRLLLALGLIAVGVGSALVFFISRAFTRPLSSLLAGVSALEQGDFTYALDSHGGDEVAELARAFDRMRESLAKTQQNLIESERLATIGRMASSISHDLRHSLAAIVANAEFLCESHLSSVQREELYQEVQSGANLMTDLIDSLLEFARTRESMNPTYGSVCDTAKRAVQAVRLNPRHHGTSIEVHCNSLCSAWFDPHKLERALYNLLLNACEAAPTLGGQVQVTVGENAESVSIAVSDNGPGVAESIRDTLFHPFVSHGKQNGTGLGLA